MRKLNIIIFVFTFFFSGSVVFAQSETNQEIPKTKSNQPIPEGMEAVQIGGSAQLIVPKGAKTRKVGAQIIVEGTKEYMSRRFFEMEKRLAEIEKRQDEMAKEIGTLKKNLEQQQTTHEILKK